MLQEILADYLKFFPEEQSNLERLVKQLQNGEKLNDRRNFNGHVCGSAIVLSADRQKILLIDHKLLKKWLQPGGHWESDDEPNPLIAAEREAEEETGVSKLEYLPVDAKRPLIPLDMNSHPIPANAAKAEPDHWHHDFRYVFVSPTEALTHQEAEVNAAAWFDLDAPETEHVQGMITKLRQVGFITA